MRGGLRGNTRGNTRAAEDRGKDLEEGMRWKGGRAGGYEQREGGKGLWWGAGDPLVGEGEDARKGSRCWSF